MAIVTSAFVGAIAPAAPTTAGQGGAATATPRAAAAAIASNTGTIYIYIYNQQPLDLIIDLTGYIPAHG